MRPEHEVLVEALTGTTRNVRHGVLVEKPTEDVLGRARRISERYDLPNALNVRKIGPDIEAIELFVAKRLTEMGSPARSADETQAQIARDTLFNLDQIIGAHRVDYKGNPRRLHVIETGTKAILDHMDANPVRGNLFTRRSRRRSEAWIAGTSPRMRLGGIKPVPSPAR